MTTCERCGAEATTTLTDLMEQICDTCLVGAPREVIVLDGPYTKLRDARLHIRWLDEQGRPTGEAWESAWMPMDEANRCLQNALEISAMHKTRVDLAIQRVDSKRPW